MATIPVLRTHILEIALQYSVLGRIQFLDIRLRYIVQMSCDINK